MNPILPQNFEINYDGQIYRPVATEPYVTKDGRETCLVSWATNCPRCDAAFIVKTGKKFRSSIRRFCDAHTRTGSVSAMRKRLAREIRTNGGIQ